MRLLVCTLNIIILILLPTPIGLTADFDVILRELARADKRISSMFVASIENEIRSIQGTDVTRGNLDWGIFGPDAERLEILSGIPVKELKAMNESALEAFSLYSSERELRSDIAYIHNPKYGTILSYNRAIQSWEIYKFENNPIFIYDSHPLHGLVAMMPYRWSLSRLKECNGVKLISCETNPEDPNLITTKFRLDIASNNSPFKEPFQGTWSMNYDQKLGYIIAQQFIADNRSDTVSYEFQFKPGSEFPSKLIKIMEFELGGKAKIENRYEFIKVSATHSLPKEAAFLPFYGLPDPSSDVSRFFRFGNAWVFGIFFLLLGLVIFRLANRKK